MSPEEAQRLADEYQKKVLANLIAFLPLTGNVTPSPTTNTNEEEPPRSRFN